MQRPDDIVRRARALFGDRLLGIFAFGSRVVGRSRPDSDLDLGVWIGGPMRRADTWVPWVGEFGDEFPVLDPTFFGDRTLVQPSSWLLEAVTGGTDVWFDASGELAARLRTIRTAVDAGDWTRRLFMGLPYYERATP